MRHANFSSALVGIARGAAGNAVKQAKNASDSRILVLDALGFAFDNQ